MVRFWVFLLYFCAAADAVRGMKGDTWTIVGGILLLLGLPFAFRRRPSARRFSAASRWVTALALISALAEMGVHVADRKVGRRLPVGEAARLSARVLSKAQEAFEDRARAAVASARAVAILPSWGDVLPPRREADRIVAFERLLARWQRLPEARRAGIELYDASGELVAWMGSSEPHSRALLAPALAGRPFLTVNTGATFTDVVAFAPIAGGAGEVLGVAVADLPIQVNYPLSNDYLRNRGLGRELEDEMGVELELDFRDPALWGAAETPGGSEWLPLSGPEGQVLGRVRIPAGAITAAVGGRWNFRRFALYAALLGAVAYLLSWGRPWLPTRFKLGVGGFLSQVVWRGALVFAVLRVARLALLTRAWGSDLSPLTAWPPWIGGLIPLEAALGSLGLLAVSALLARWAASRARAWADTPPPPLFRAIGAPACAAVGVYLALYFWNLLSAPAVDPRLAIALQSDPTFGIEQGLILLVALCTAVSGILCLASALAGALSLAFRRGRLVPVDDRLALWTGATVLAIVASLPVFSVKSKVARGNWVQRKGSEFANPPANRTEELLDSVIPRILESESLLAAVTRRADPKPVAFQLWAKSALSASSLPATVEIYDAENRSVSRFEAGLPGRAPPDLERLAADVRAQGRIKDRGQEVVGGDPLEILTGAAAILEAGEYRGMVVVTLPFFHRRLEQALEKDPGSLEFLRSYGQRPDAGPGPGIPFVAARYRAGRLIRSFPPEVPVPALLPDAWAGTTAPRWRSMTLAADEYRLVAYRAVERPQHGLFLTAPAGEEVYLFGYRWGLADRVPVAWWVFGAFAAGALVAGNVLVWLAHALLRLFRKEGRGRRGELTFAQKLVLTLLGLSIAPLVLYFFISRTELVRRSDRDLRRDVQASLENVAAALKRRATEEAELLAANPRTVEDLRKSVAKGGAGGARARVFGALAVDGALWEGGDPPPLDVRDQEVLDHVLNREKPIAYFASGRGALYSVAAAPVYGPELVGVLFAERRLTDDVLREVAADLGRSVHLYVDGRLVAAERPDLVNAELLPARQDGAAFLSCGLLGKEIHTSTESLGDLSFLVGHTPVRGFSGEVEGTLSVPLLFQRPAIDREIRRTLGFVTVIVLGVLGVVYIVSVGLGRWFGRPIHELTEGAGQVARGDLSFRIPGRRSGEVGRLVDSFNSMVGDLARSRDEIEARRRYIETIVGSVESGVCAVEKDGSVASLNESGRRILEVGDELVAGGTLDGPGSSEASEKIGLLLAEVLETGVGKEEKWKFDARDGTRTLRARATPLLDAEDRQIGAVCAFEDLTEFERSTELRARVELSREVAHGIKNPLTPIKLATQHLRSAAEEKAVDLPEPMMKLLRASTDTVLQQIEILAGRVREISRVAREGGVPGEAPRAGEGVAGEGKAEGEAADAEAAPAPGGEPGDRPSAGIAVGELADGAVWAASAAPGGGGGPAAPAPDPIDLSQALAELVTPYSASPPAGVRVRVELDRGLGLVRIAREDLQTVVQCLLENAIEAMGEKGGSLSVGSYLEEELDGSEETRRWATLVVEDTGPGIPEEIVQRVFERNFTTKATGSGLGLAISREIAERAGGGIRIESRVDWGTKIVVRLPAGGEGS